MFRAFIFLILLLAACRVSPSPLPFASTLAPTRSPNLQSPQAAVGRISHLQLPISNLQSPISNLRVGWAYEAYPDASLEKMRADFARMRANGANTVWIGHNNPGQVDANKVEPGLSYAVYAALQDTGVPLNPDARAMADGVKRALDAARETQLQVILPIGYQIQMGAAWNAQHPAELRIKSDGTPLELYNSGYTASPYSSQYRTDITRYYDWVQREYAGPYQDVIVMLSLADEPMGGDYSDAAKQEFTRRYGKTWDNLPDADVWQLGEFQSGVIADYAAWSADEWQRINPNILTTMSFHGGDTTRRVWGLPDYEKLFSQTPNNFVVTFDAYLHDDLAAKPATADEAAQLKLFLRTIGNYSKLYAKPLVLWGGVNAWGLAQESSAPLGLTDAVTNLLMLHDLSVRAGGNVWGIFAWNYNVKSQGLENYDRPTTYDAQAMEIAVNRTFPILRTRPQSPESSPLDIAILVSQRAMYNALGQARTSDVPPQWFDTTQYAQALADRNAILLTTPFGAGTLDSVRYIVLSATLTSSEPGLEEFIRARLAAGSNVLAASDTLARQWDIPTEAWEHGLTQLPDAAGTFYVIAFEE